METTALTPPTRAPIPDDVFLETYLRINEAPRANARRHEGVRPAVTGLKWLKIAGMSGVVLAIGWVALGQLRSTSSDFSEHARPVDPVAPPSPAEVNKLQEQNRRLAVYIEALERRTHRDVDGSNSTSTGETR